MVLEGQFLKIAQWYVIKEKNKEQQTETEDIELPVHG